MSNPLRTETLRDEIATIIQVGARTTKSAAEIAGEIMHIMGLGDEFTEAKFEAEVDAQADADFKNSHERLLAQGLIEECRPGYWRRTKKGDAVHAEFLRNSGK